MGNLLAEFGYLHFLSILAMIKKITICLGRYPSDDSVKLSIFGPKELNNNHYAFASYLYKNQLKHLFASDLFNLIHVQFANF